ncbi:unnamed protein product, partial [Symbiodinium sp. CCMP2592]
DVADGLSLVKLKMCTKDYDVIHRLADLRDTQGQKTAISKLKHVNDTIRFWGEPLRPLIQ